MAKLWAGRFKKETDQAVNAFNASIGVDQRMYREDIEGSMAHAAMLSRQGIITEEDGRQIRLGLQSILKDMDAGAISLTPEQYEDIHMANEQLLTERIGEAGKRLHTARSRNDQVALDLRLYVRREIGEIAGQITELLEELCTLAEANAETVMPGYTHLQRAQPITFGHHLMAYANMFRRDAKRLENCLEGMDEMPLGCGALAGTTYPIDREFAAGELGFSRVTDNSLDGVSDRDYCMELCGCLSILMVHLSRLSEEIILWCSWEFKFVELDDAFSTGSSIMPQKKNPDVCELIRGKAGRVFGDLQTLLVMMKGLPLAYNKDMQEDKEAVFDAIDTVKACLEVLTPMMATMTVLPDNMRAAARKGFLNATDCADYLTKKGLPFRDAYRAVGELVAICIETGHVLDDLPLDQYQAVCPLFEADVYQAIDLKTCVGERKSLGGPAPDEVRRQIQKIRAFLESRKSE
ncbi:MAG TPA: argininosuccinate lyase [Candidatus Lachnoclostridium stercoripullorum]|uniref:Argininosuccinate lyase n=1 Tax=Candidatus Lachnoclostridium stercoripullorum TaxID=2838635 RepID=A0A9D1W2U5_9FIRM|nr:argininosuccinate lyase [Candidatus Lachnoclostridium stercoripullorum]